MKKRTYTKNAAVIVQKSNLLNLNTKSFPWMLKKWLIKISYLFQLKIHHKM